jgi:hypothetical protein
VTETGVHTYDKAGIRFDVVESDSHANELHCLPLT